MRQTWVAAVVRAGMMLALVLAGQAMAQVKEEPLRLETPTGTLAGTLALPGSSGKPPVVLIIAGSGPTDRDGNSAMLPGHNDSLNMLATALAEAGFASLRYDKRGVGASLAATPAESALRFDTYVDDAAAWIARLNADPRFGAVTVLGHSEGALIGMMAAQRGGAAAYVSIAGIADGTGTILRRQLAGKLPPELAAANERILASLEGGTTVADVPAQLMVFYRPSVQPYLVSQLRIQPAAELAKLRIPVLVVQGTTDIQVGVDQAKALKLAKQDAQLSIIPGMNHVLKDVPADSQRQLASYGDPALPLAPGLVPAITGFLRGLPAAQR